MRISSNQLSTSGLREIINRQAELREIQLKMATQKRFLTPSDDPVAATSVLNLETEISLFEQYNRNIDLAKGANELEEGVLNSVTNTLFRVKELLVGLGNGVYGQNELEAIKIEIEERLNEMVGYANTQSANGDYLFSGFKTKVQPFVQDASGNIVYQGDQGERSIRITTSTLVGVSDSGFEVFEDVFDGNKKFVVSADATNTGTGSITIGSYQAPPAVLAEPYDIQFLGPNSYQVVGVNSAAVIVPPTPFASGDTISFNGITVSVDGTPAAGDNFYVDPSSRQSIFNTLKDAIAMVDNFVDTPQGRAIYTTQLDVALANFDNAFEKIDQVRARVGTRLNAIESGRDSNEQLIFTSKGLLSKLKDLDVVEAASELTRQTTVLEAAQASFVRVQNLNIFNFLR